MAWNPKYEINLVSVLTRMGKNTRQVREIVTSPEFKRDYGQAVVDEITVRTREKNIDKNSKRFPAYEKSYKDSQIFNQYGKSASDINLTLTGNMIDSLNYKVTPQKVIVNLDGQDNRNKAQGHIDGIVTKKGKVKVRDFLGLPEKTEEKIISELLSVFKVQKLVEQMSDFDISPTITQSGRGTTELEIELEI